MKAGVGKHNQRTFKKIRDFPSIIDALEFRREQYGMSQAEMAEELDWYESHYSEFRRGKRDLPWHAMRKAYEMGVPASVLFQVPNKVKGSYMWVHKIPQKRKRSFLKVGRRKNTAKPSDS